MISIDPFTHSAYTWSDAIGNTLQNQSNILLNFWKTSVSFVCYISEINIRYRYLDMQLNKQKFVKSEKKSFGGGGGGGGGGEICLPSNPSPDMFRFK